MQDLIMHLREKILDNLDNSEYLERAVLLGSDSLELEIVDLPKEILNTGVYSVVVGVNLITYDISGKEVHVTTDFLKVLPVTLPWGMKAIVDKEGSLLHKFIGLRSKRIVLNLDMSKYNSMIDCDFISCSSFHNYADCNLMIKTNEYRINSGAKDFKWAYSCDKVITTQDSEIYYFVATSKNYLRLIELVLEKLEEKPFKVIGDKVIKKYFLFSDKSMTEEAYNLLKENTSLLYLISKHFVGFYIQRANSRTLIEFP